MNLQPLPPRPRPQPSECWGCRLLPLQTTVHLSFVAQFIGRFLSKMSPLLSYSKLPTFFSSNPSLGKRHREESIVCAFLRQAPSSGYGTMLAAHPALALLPAQILMGSALWGCMIGTLSRSGITMVQACNPSRWGRRGLPQF